MSAGDCAGGESILGAETTVWSASVASRKEAVGLLALGGLPFAQELMLETLA